MVKSNILIIVLLAIIFIGFFHSRTYIPTTTTETVFIRGEPPHYYRRFGYRPPPALCPYRAQYY